MTIDVECAREEPYRHDAEPARLRHALDGKEQIPTSLTATAPHAASSATSMKEASARRSLVNRWEQR